MMDTVEEQSGFFRLLALNKVPKFLGSLGLYNDPLGDFTYTFKKDETREKRKEIFLQLQRSDSIVGVTMICGEFKKFQIDLIYDLLTSKKDQCILKMIGGPCYFPEKENFSDEEKAIKEFEDSKEKLSRIVEFENAFVNRALKRKLFHFISFESLEPDKKTSPNYIYKEFPHGPKDRSQDAILIEDPKSFVICDYQNKYGKSLVNTVQLKTKADIDQIELYNLLKEKCNK
jgi:hypothetical protein